MSIAVWERADGLPSLLFAAMMIPSAACCAGKTTLGHLLMRNLHELTIAFAACYADHVGGGRFLPRQEARSVQEREQALRHLLTVEANRLAQVPGGSDLILADRSVHTLLAHSCALEQMTRLAVFAPSVRLLRASPLAAWPDLAVYLDLPQQAVQSRNNGKFPPGSIYTDPGASTPPSAPVSCDSPARKTRVSPGSMPR